MKIKGNYIGVGCLLLVMGCVVPGGGGDGTDDSGGGGGSSSDMMDDSLADDGDTVDGEGEADGIPGDDSSDDASEDLPVAFRLDGVWDDNGRHVIVEQNGTTVSGMYFSQYFCDVVAGPVPVNEDPSPGANVFGTFFDFEGMLSAGEDVLPGDTITGETSFCRFGNDDDSDGLDLAAMTLTVIDHDTISGEWNTVDLSGSIHLTRQQ